jgi:hypothetical protein
MEIIQFTKNGGQVTIDVTIDGVQIWSYVYAADRTFRNKANSGNPSHHALGLPIDLEDDNNVWDIRLGNLSKSVTPADITIRWKQGNTELKVWSQRVQVPAESAVQVSGDAMLHSI